MEAVMFFRSEEGFKRLMDSFVKNYISLGRIGGTVKLTKTSMEEREALSGIMGKDYSNQEDISISLADFQKALNNTKFANLDLKDLLIAFTGGNLLTRMQKEEKYGQEKESFFAELKQIHKGNNSRLILDYIQSKGSSTRGVHQIYDKDHSFLKALLDTVLNAVEELPEGYERLPVFASRITKDPHAFDLSSDRGRLLVLALQIILSNREKSYRIISTPSAEQVTEILGNFNIIRDDLLNFVTCAGLLGHKDGLVIPMWQEAIKDKIVLNVPLREIVRIASFVPVTYGNCAAIRSEQTGTSSEKAVFIVENSGVFSEIVDWFIDKNGNLPPIICTHGQFKLAALLLMDKLVKNGIDLYYSGDFDPEGLQMAQRLIERYPTALKLWRYTVDDYERCLSDIALTQSRVNKLKAINSPNLISLKERMVANCRAGYQEHLLPLLISDLDCFKV